MCCNQKAPEKSFHGHPKGEDPLQSQLTHFILVFFLVYPSFSEIDSGHCSHICSDGRRYKMQPCSGVHKAPCMMLEKSEASTTISVLLYIKENIN